MWPSDKRNVSPCGTYISQRLCPDSSRKQVKISFQPKTSPVLEGYHKDSGLPYGSHQGVVYGWSTDMSSQCKDWTRVLQSPPTRLMATNCGFNADPRSKWCVTNSETSFLCENAAWMIKLPNRE